MYFGNLYMHTSYCHNDLYSRIGSHIIIHVNVITISSFEKIYNIMINIVLRQFASVAQPIDSFVAA